MAQVCNLNIGDRVRRINGENSGMKDGDTGVVTSVDQGKYCDVKNDRTGRVGNHHQENFVLISTNYNTMNLLEQAKLAFKGEPEKSFIKAGVLDSNKNLTTDGQQLFLTYLLKKHGEDFKTTVIDPIIKAGENK